MMKYFLWGLLIVVLAVALINRAKVANFLRRMREFYHEVVNEMHKVAWPTKNHVIGSTILVFISTISLMLVLWGVDKLLGELVGMVFRS